MSKSAACLQVCVLLLLALSSHSLAVKHNTCFSSSSSLHSVSYTMLLKSKSTCRRGMQGMWQIKVNHFVCMSSDSVESGSFHGFRKAGPDTPMPVYADSSLFDQLAIKTFRAGMVSNLGQDVPEEGYKGLMQLALQLNRQYSPEETQERTRKILASLFPPFILKLFPLMFSKPFPAFSAKLNAFITRRTCQWLMGPQTLFNVESSEMQEGWGDGEGQGILIERCRYLEESACASVCANSCKVPTQQFFIQDMGIPLSIEPNYDTFECKFKFGVLPKPQKDDDVFSSLCFTQCPSKSRRRHADVTNETPAADMCSTLVAAGNGETKVPEGKVFVENLRKWVAGEDAK